MAEPMAADPRPAVPPDPMTQAGNRLIEAGADTARSMAERKLRQTVKSYLPKVLHPLIPGEGGSVVENAKGAVSRWFWGIVTSAVISLVFFALFAFAVVGFLLVTAYAVLSST